MSLTKLTLKQENFCLAYIETGNASEAYRRAYECSKMKDATITRSAKELIDNHNITARIEELRKPIIKRHNITVDDLIAELNENRDYALKAETVQSSAATTATMAKAKLLGMLVEKVEHTGSVTIMASPLDEKI
jgi:phage terminase small subunit